METHTCIIALGANLGNRQLAFEKAISLVMEKVGKVVAQSSWIDSRPLGEEGSQPDYLNAVILVETTLLPEKLLETLHEIERTLGRKREEEKLRWESRLIDLDIIAYDDLVLKTENLTIPHPEMHKREFVLRPLLEIAPDWQHPVFKKSVGELLA